MSPSTREELERSIRRVLPKAVTNPSSSRSTTAAAGAGGLLTGYVWGWFKGRRRRRQREKR